MLYRVVDNTYTQERLVWNCTLKMSKMERIPVILKRYEAQKINGLIKMFKKTFGNILILIEIIYQITLN